MKYNIIRKMKDDQTLLERTYRLLNERIQFMIDEKLGFHGFTYEDVKIQCQKNPDRFTSAFAALEELDRERILVRKELDMINDYFIDIDKLISRMNDREKKVFKAKYLYGLSNMDIAAQLDCSEKTIQRLIKEIEKN
jgi:RNA polymerase sigma factor (sigma-70 family)